MAAALALGGGLLAGLGAAGPRTISIGPEQDFCAALRALQPGSELVLAPGDYPAGCSLWRGGAPGAPVVIRAADPAARPRLAYEGRRSNVLNVRADHVVIRGLRFGPTQAGVDGVRIYAREDVTVEDCEFSEIGGIPLVANHVSLRGLAVRRNAFLDSRSTAMYFGCHDGAACAVSEAVIERNYVRRTGIEPGGVGYGVQIKLNSAADIRDNVIVQPRGPGIMVYGAHDPRVSVVERNVVRGSGQSSGIVVGGGPAVVRNNIAIGNAEGGIALEDYGRRGLLRQIAVVHNTVYGNSGGGILLTGAHVQATAVANNAVHVRGNATGWGRRAPWPPAQPGLELAGNVNCSTWAPCFADPEGGDFSPGRLLIGAGTIRIEPWMPPDDLLGLPRSQPPTAGALDRAADPIRDAPRPAQLPGS